LTSYNAGTAQVTGWEFSYQQQASFLPGLLKTLSVGGNLTLLKAKGKFDGTAQLTSGQVANFIPRASNVQVKWNYRRFGLRVLYNFTSEHPISFGLTTPGRNLYRFDYETIDLGLTYQVRPALSLSCNVSNLGNEPYMTYRYSRERLRDYIVNGTTVTVGVNGRF
jgi:outer membrane receptor protein involved in Fe transport